MAKKAKKDAADKEYDRLAAWTEADWIARFPILRGISVVYCSHGDEWPVGTVAGHAHPHEGVICFRTRAHLRCPEMILHEIAHLYQGVIVTEGYSEHPYTFYALFNYLLATNLPHWELAHMDNSTPIVKKQT